MLLTLPDGPVCATASVRSRHLGLDQRGARFGDAVAIAAYLGRAMRSASPRPTRTRTSATTQCSATPSAPEGSPAETDL